MTPARVFMGPDKLALKFKKKQKGLRTGHMPLKKEVEGL